MKTNRNKQVLTNSLIEILCIGILTTLVFSLKLNTILLICFVLLAIFSKYKNFSFKLKNSEFIGIHIILFLLFFVSAYYSTDQEHGYKFVERNLVLLFIPITVSLIDFKKFNFTRILRWTILLITLIVTFALLKAFYNNYLFNIENSLPIYQFKSWFFTYHYLAENINCTAIYLSLLFSICVITLVLDATAYHSISINRSNFIKWSWIGYLIAIMILLSARTILSITILSVFVIMIRHAIYNGYFRKFTLIMIPLVLLSIVTIQKNDVLRLRFLAAFTAKENTKYFSGGLSSRVYQWQGILKDTFQNNPFFGTGVGDVNQGYKEIYQSNGLDWAVTNAFNAHNMYIELFYSTGFLGLLLFLVILWFSFKKALEKKDFRYFLFLMIFTIAGLTESLMNRQYGIVYFVLLNSLMYFQPLNNKT